MLTDLPEWLKEFKENLVDRELPASAHISQESDLKHPRNSDVCLKTKMTRDPCRRRTDEGLTSCRKVRWLDNDWSQSPQRGRWVSKQSPIRCRHARSCHSMDSILSVQNKIFTWDKKNCLILGVVVRVNLCVSAHCSDRRSRRFSALRSIQQQQANRSKQGSHNVRIITELPLETDDGIMSRVTVIMTSRKVLRIWQKICCFNYFQFTVKRQERSRSKRRTFVKR